MLNHETNDETNGRNVSSAKGRRCVVRLPLSIIRKECSDVFNWNSDDDQTRIHPKGVQVVLGRTCAFALGGFPIILLSLRPHLN